MLVREAFKLLKKAGFIELNQVGSHRKFGKDEKRITIVIHRSEKEELHPNIKQVKELTDGY
jgi:predicted RNA binding protein YcfA (HicA-like mRNA interferase family)